MQYTHKSQELRVVKRNVYKTVCLELLLRGSDDHGKEVDFALVVLLMAIIRFGRLHCI